MSIISNDFLVFFHDLIYKYEEKINYERVNRRLKTFDERYNESLKILHELENIQIYNHLNDHIDIGEDSDINVLIEKNFVDFVCFGRNKDMILDKKNYDGRIKVHLTNKRINKSGTLIV